MIRTLVPLRIPPGWTVVFNSFHELDPIIKDGVFENASEFEEDMLLIRRAVIETRPDQYILDVGWIPSLSPKGAFRLTLVLGSWETILKQFESRSWVEIQTKLDAWLEVLSTYMEPNEATKHLP
jgi:hypothetical protein